MSMVEVLVLNTEKLYINDVESLVENPVSSSIKFVADTGATEHLVKSYLVLTDFKRSEGDFIQSTNKNTLENLESDVYGNLVPISTAGGGK